MKTVISNKTGEALEVAKRIFYSIQVLGIGLFIPFMFVFGISYHLPEQAQNEREVHATNAEKLMGENNTVDYVKLLSHQTVDPFVK